MILLSRKYLPLTILLVSVVLIYAIYSLKPKPVSQPQAELPAPRVSAFVAAPKSQRIIVSAQGTVQPKREIDLTAQVSGLISSVADNFVNGGFFKQGDGLLSIDPRDYRIEVVRAESRLADAKQLLAIEWGRARQAKREWRDLGNAEGNALFLREPQLAAATAALAAAKADVEQAKLNLERTIIVAPADGRVRETMVNVGQYVAPGTKLSRVFSTDVAEVRLPLTARQAVLIELPLRAGDQQTPATELNFTYGDHEYSWTGNIVRTDASIDTGSRVIYGIVEVQKPYENKPPLAIGLFVKAKITGRQFDNVLTLPRTALYEKTNLLTVDAENRLRITPVTVLQDRGQIAYITGIAAGEKVLLNRPGYVVDGMKVSPVIEE